MIDDTADDSDGGEPSATRADWAALRERLLEQRRRNMGTDSWELQWFAHHIGKLIPDCTDHPLFLATLRAHWFTSTVEPSDHGRDGGGDSKESVVRQCVVTIDPEDLRSDLPGVARDIQRTLEQHPWAKPPEISPRELTPAQGKVVAATLAALRGFKSRRS